MLFTHYQWMYDIKMLFWCFVAQTSWCYAVDIEYCAAVVDVKNCIYRGNWCACAWIFNVLLEIFSNNTSTTYFDSFAIRTMYFSFSLIWFIWWPQNAMRDKDVNVKVPIRHVAIIYRACQIVWIWIWIERKRIAWLIKFRNIFQFFPHMLYCDSLLIFFFI